MQDLSTLSLAELKQIAKERGLKGISSLKKAELIQVLSASVKTNTPAAAKADKTEISAAKADKADAVSAAAEEKSGQQLPQAAPKDTEARRAPSSDRSRTDGMPRRNQSPDRDRNIGRSQDPDRDRNNGRSQDLRKNVRINRGNLTGGNSQQNQPRSGEHRTYSGSDTRQNGNIGQNSGAGQNTYGSRSGQNRTGYRQDGRSDGRQDNRGENRQYAGQASRSAGRSDNRSDVRSDYRQDSRSDYRQDSRPACSNSIEAVLGRPQSEVPAQRYDRDEVRYDTPTVYPASNYDSMIPASADMKSEAMYQTEMSYRPEADYKTDPRQDAVPGVEDISVLDSGETAHGILEVMPDGYGFIRCANYMPGDNDIYVSPSQIRRFNLKTGDIIEGSIRIKTGQEKFAALLFVKTVNNDPVSVAEKRKNFEDLTPIFPDEKIRLETPGGALPMRVMDMVSPIGKGQRGMIVSPPKAGKTTLLKEVAKAVTMNHPEMHLIILLIDERPEEVTDMKESITGENVEIIYSTFDELPEHHKRVSEMVISRAKRLVEHGHDVMILLDSITRLSRAYNLVVPPSGRTLSGGLDPTALYMPKKFFGAARNMREGGSLTILATALVDTGSRMDDVVFEEFKGTGNMELVLDRKLSEKRIFPAIDMLKSGTRRDELLLSPQEYDAMTNIRKVSSSMKPEEATEHILDLFLRTRNNRDLSIIAQKISWLH